MSDSNMYAFESRFWGRRDIKKLKANYLRMPLSKLSQTLDRGVFGIVQKLMRLAKEFPEEWDIRRANAFNNELVRAYRIRNRERINARTYEGREMRWSIYARFAEKQREWTERDTNVLATTYLSRDYQELVKIFALKGTDVATKLRELYEEDPDSWEAERIGELEQQAKSLPEQTKIKLKGYHSSIAYLRRLGLREDIDSLVEEGKPYRKIGSEVGMSYEGVRLYLISRNLMEWYNLMRSQKASRKSKGLSPQQVLNR